MQRIAISARSAGSALTSAWVAPVPWAIGVVLANPLGVVARFALGHVPNVVPAGVHRHHPSRLPLRRLKNVLATVSAVAAHTMDASGSMADFVAALDGRLRSMRQ